MMNLPFAVPTIIIHHRPKKITKSADIITEKILKRSNCGTTLISKNETLYINSVSWKLNEVIIFQEI